MDYHTNHLGSVTNLTDQFGRVAARSDYSDWGEVTAYDTITVDQGFRMLMPEVTYATHEYDDVLNHFYAKARMHDAENKQFTEVDSIKGIVTAPMSMVQYLYVKDKPLNYVDLLGLKGNGNELPKRMGIMRSKRETIRKSTGILEMGSRR